MGMMINQWNGAWGVLLNCQTHHKYWMILDGFVIVDPPLQSYQFHREDENPWNFVCLPCGLKERRGLGKLQ